MYIAKNRSQAIAQARAVLRLTGAGHSAAIHCTDEQTAMAYASTVEVYRVIVNAPCSQGAAGFATHLAPTFTIGTGYFGRSSIGENVGPQHLSAPPSSTIDVTRYQLRHLIAEELRVFLKNQP